MNNLDNSRDLAGVPSSLRDDECARAQDGFIFHFSKALRKAENEGGFGDLGWKSRRLLWRLAEAEHEGRQTDLRTAVGLSLMKRRTGYNDIRVLRRRGWVEFYQDSNSRRRKKVALTPRAHQVISDICRAFARRFSFEPDREA